MPWPWLFSVSLFHNFTLRWSKFWTSYFSLQQLLGRRCSAPYSWCRAWCKAVGGVIPQKGSWPWTPPIFVRGKDALKHIATFQLSKCSGDNRAVQRRPLQSSHLQFLWTHQAYSLSLAQNIWAIDQLQMNCILRRQSLLWHVLLKKAKQRWPTIGLM